jgi:hypothetical protein
MQAAFKKYESVSNYEGTDKDTLHAYGPLYERLFAPIKDSCKDFLEIGVFSGASLAAFADFFEHAQLIGIDIDLSRLKFGKDHPRIAVHQMDGTQAASASQLGRQFDVILDDGSHLPNHQVASLDVFAPYLKPDGMYVIEDINGAYVHDLKPRLESTAKKHGLTMEWYDLRQVKGRFDDIVAVFRRQQSKPEGPSVAIVAIARREHPYIREFIEVHRRLGVTGFYIYDNGLPGDEPLTQTLAGVPGVHVINFPGETMQMPAYAHFIHTVLPMAPEEWFAVLDVDEFLVPVQHKTLPAFLKEYGHLGAIGVNWRMFMTDGHVHKPEGGVVSNYVRSRFNIHIKTLSHRSQLTLPINNVHNVSGACRRLDGTLIIGAFNHNDQTDIIRINHYFSKSWQEFAEKVRRGRADTGMMRRVTDHTNELLGAGYEEDTALCQLLGEPVRPTPTADLRRDLQGVLDPEDYLHVMAFQAALGGEDAEVEQGGGEAESKVEQE